MRIIKFRVWDKEGEQMHPDWQLHPNFGLLLSSERFIPMQYTGTKDTNGVEICEGDIVKPITGKSRRIKYHAGSFLVSSFSKRSRGNVLSPALVHGRRFEVIGNIYENPTLKED